MDVCYIFFPKSVSYRYIDGSGFLTECLPPDIDDEVEVYPFTFNVLRPFSEFCVLYGSQCGVMLQMLKES